MFEILSRRLRFAAQSLKERGLVSGGRFLKRWYYARLAGYPHVVNFEVSSFCNLKCPFCYTHARGDFSGRGARKLSLDVYKKIIDDSRAFCTAAVLHGMGEPLLHPGLFEMVEYAEAAHMDTLFSTNGLLLTPEKSCRLVEVGLSRIIISFDGCSEETYMIHRAGSRNGDYEKLKTHIRALVQEKQRQNRARPWITLQFIVTKKNAHEVSEFEPLARSLKVNEAELMSLAIDDYVRDPDYGAFVEREFFVPASEAFGRYEVNDQGQRLLIGKSSNRICPQLAGGPVVTSDSKIVGCCKDLHTLDDTFGDLNKQSFREVWNSSAFRNFRADVMMPARMRKCDSCFPDDREYSLSLFRSSNP
jgi:MoaA/NifB/PqqE/SkfB family radical SAM enzyme